ncbi:hypothetical protein SAMN05444412_11071 [Rhodonellum ikkaensis]|uniref:Uncharacterized protein n=1 Tax=Rhodonellum ikkaensis TaxID=336829 RepID=A0A1H3S344_9BACT|nr:hypothetical protein SAMN05444412_11071 [Rhodonellum ikkaensis]
MRPFAKVDAGKKSPSQVANQILFKFRFILQAAVRLLRFPLQYLFRFHSISRNPRLDDFHGLNGFRQGYVGCFNFTFSKNRNWGPKLRYWF